MELSRHRQSIFFRLCVCFINVSLPSRTTMTSTWKFGITTSSVKALSRRLASAPMLSYRSHYSWHIIGTLAGEYTRPLMYNWPQKFLDTLFDKRDRYSGCSSVGNIIFLNVINNLQILSDVWSVGNKVVSERTNGNSQVLYWRICCICEVKK